MEGERNVAHHFDLSKCAPGDWFLGCPRCWFQLEKNAAAKPICPLCDHDLRVYNVTWEDVVPGKILSLVRVYLPNKMRVS